MKRLLLSLILIQALLLPVAGQQPSTSPRTPQKQDDRDEVVRITSNLVQVDVTVTDKKGRPIPNLTPEDFEIYEDGKPQKLTNFSFINTAETAVPTPTPHRTERTGKKPVAPPPPPIVLRPEQVRRTVALVVDDLGLSFESMHFVRNALRKFVDERMQEGDLVAIIRTGAGVGALQQFTSDKRLLHAAIERVKWNSSGRAGIYSFPPLADSPLLAASMRPGADGLTATDATKNDIEKNMQKGLADFKDEIFQVGTLGALNYIVRGLRPLPGRKSVVLLSDTLNLFDTKGEGNYRTIQALRRLTDLANRASVVVYSIDPRGLPTLNISASDNTTGITSLQNGSVVLANSGPSKIESLNSRTADMWKSQEGLKYLAFETGGFFSSSNDVNLGIDKALDDSKSYYLLGYRPDDSTFDKSGQRRYHNISVKVRHSEAIVRTRTGFYGISEEEATPLRNTPLQHLLAAIASPFSSGEIDLRLTSIFLDEAQVGSFMRSFIYVDGRSLTFKEEADGTYRAALDVLAMTFNDQGLPVDQRSRSQEIVLPRAQYQTTLDQGLIFGINLPVKTPGAFQLRIAVLDNRSGRLGSANQFIEVPDLKKNRLRLSGLYLAERNPAQDILVRLSSASKESDTGYQGDPQSGPVIRRFRAGSMLEYAYEIYNAQLDKTTRLQQLQSHIRLFRDNKLVSIGKVLTLKGQPDMKKLVAFGQFPLSPSLTPGDYVLQVIVTDALAKEKYSVATQWIDFEIR